MDPITNTGNVIAVCLNADPGVPKHPAQCVQLVEDYGVEGDYHAGKLIRHRYLARKDPSQPNHRHVLLTDTSIYADLAAQDIHLQPGMLAENVVLDGINVMGLPLGAQIELGETLLEVTEIRTPCALLNVSHPKLFEAVKEKEKGGIPNSGIFARILKGGQVQAGDAARVHGK